MKSAILLALLVVIPIAAEPLRKPADTDSEAVKKLRKELVECARLLKAMKEQYTAGRCRIGEPNEWIHRLYAAEAVLATMQDQRIAAAQTFLENAKEIETMSKSKFDAGRIGIAEYQHGIYIRIEAQIALLKAEGK